MGTLTVATEWSFRAFSVRVVMGIATSRTSNKALGACVSSMAEAKAFVALIQFNIFHG